jgi:PAS domain S-box-containing protein
MTTAQELSTPLPDGASILVVDDQPYNLTALEAVIAPLGHRVVKATSGDEALKHLLKEDFAVILLDVKMPVLDGFQTASFIKGHKRVSNVPIIFVTGESVDVAQIFRAYSHGAVDYLLKPIDPGVLRAKVAVFVELFRKGEHIKRQEARLRQMDRERLERVSAQALAESEERYRSLVLATAQIVWTTNTHGEITTDSPSWVAFTGQSAEEHRGLGWLDALHPEDREQTRNLLAEALVRKEQYDTEYRLRRPDGSYRLMSVRCVPVRKPDGAIREWIGANVDITDRRTTEEARQQLYEYEVAAREAAQEGVKIRDDFLAIASHELNTPLMPLKLQIEMLRKRDTTPEVRARRLETVELQVDRMTKLVSQLLDVSRIAAGRLALEPEELDLAPVVCDVASRFTRNARGGCGLHVSADVRTVVYMDRMRVEQLITNLLSNAIKYGDAKPVEVTLEAVGGMARISVRDHGIGIEPEAQARIFERFERAVSVKHYGGFGLGLWIARQIVEASGGRIAVESKPGAGSLFSVDIPLVEGGSAPAE